MYALWKFPVIHSLGTGAQASRPSPLLPPPRRIASPIRASRRPRRIPLGRSSPGNTARGPIARPRIDPSSGLGESGRIAEEIRILEVLEQLLCSVAVGVAFEHRKWKVDRNQISADRIIELLPCRRRWPGRIGRTAAADIRSCRQVARQNRQERRPGPLQKSSPIHGSGL
jgi:hypothetical protein